MSFRLVHFFNYRRPQHYFATKFRTIVILHYAYSDAYRPRHTHQEFPLVPAACSIHTVVSLCSAENLSSCAAADFSKASCFLMSDSTSSMVWPSSCDIRYGSWAISHASATAASRANWYTSRTGNKLSISKV